VELKKLEIEKKFYDKQEFFLTGVQKKGFKNIF
jgi:hypothetical protein